MGRYQFFLLLAALLLMAASIPVAAATSPTTELRVVKYAADQTTVLAEKTVDYQWMEQNLPVRGDGTTHYYHQGPVFEGNAWNPTEDTNVLEKDMGAVRGTDIKDLCGLVGGAEEMDTIRIRAADGLTTSYPYEYIYTPDSRQGPMVVTWYRADQGYVPDYYEGMRLVIFADTSTNPWHYPIFGVWDMHECWDEEYWYFYQPGLPTTTGISVKYISEIAIFSQEEPTGSIRVSSNPSGARIFIDDDDTGSITNATIDELETGSYPVSVFLEGYAEPDEEYVTVLHDQVAEVHFDLMPDLGSLDISTSPPGARVVLDGEDTGRVTPVLLEGLASGSHTVMVELEGFEPADDDVEIFAGETSDIHFDLFPMDDSEQESGYAGQSLQVIASDTFPGYVDIFSSTEKVFFLESGENAHLTVPLDAAAAYTTRYARLYIFVSDFSGRKESWSDRSLPNLSVEFENTVLKPDRTYTDYNISPGSGPYTATLCYNVTRLLRGTGGCDVMVDFDGSSGESLTLMGAALFAARETPSGNPVIYWLAEGCDAIWADSLSGIDTDTSASTTRFSGTILRDQVSEARLIDIATSPSWSSDREHRITFNDGEWYNVLPEEGEGIGVSIIDALNFLKSSGNEASLASFADGTKGDCLENRLAVLVISPSAGTGDSAAIVSDIATGETGSKDVKYSASTDCYDLSGLNRQEDGLHLKNSKGTVQLHFSAGTTVAAADGNDVPLLCLKAAETLPDDAMLSFSISPPDAVADRPFVLAATNFDGASEPGFLRYSEETGTWDEVKTWYSAREGLASCSITGFGTYALVDHGAQQNGQNPIFALINGFIELLASIFMTPQPQASPLEKIGQVTAWAEPVVLEDEPDMPVKDRKFSCTIRSNPSGALIYIDGSYTGRTTPSTVSVNPGEYSIGIELEGFKPVTVLLSVLQDEDQYFELFPLDSPYLSKKKFDTSPATDKEKTGVIFVTSVPSGGSIYIDGKLTSFITPKVVSGLREGRHTIKVKKEAIEFPVESREVWVIPNLVEEVAFDLSPPIQTSSYTILSGVLSGMPFTLNGEMPEYKIPATIEAGGINSYITVKDGDRYLSYHLTVANAEDYEMYLEADSTRTRALSVVSTPKGAEIFIDGFSTGLCTPFSISGLSAGQHLVGVKKPGYLPAETMVLIPEGSSILAGTEQFFLEAYPYGTLVIDSEPQGAKIYIHNRYTGEKTPHTFKYMSIGTYSVKVVGDEVTKERDDLSVEPWTITKYQFNLLN